MIQIHERCMPYNLWWAKLELELYRRKEIINMMDQATYNDEVLCNEFVQRCLFSSPAEPIFVYVSDVDSIRKPIDSRLFYLVENSIEVDKFCNIGGCELYDMWIRPHTQFVVSRKPKINRIITVTDIERDEKTFRESVIAYFNVEQKLIENPIFAESSYEIYSPTQGEFSPFNTINFNGFSPTRVVAEAVADSKLFVYTMNVTSTPWWARIAIGFGTPFLVPNNESTNWLPAKILYSSMEELEHKIESILLLDELGQEYQNLIKVCGLMKYDFDLDNQILTLLYIRDSIKEGKK